MSFLYLLAIHVHTIGQGTANTAKTRLKEIKLFLLSKVKVNFQKIHLHTRMIVNSIKCGQTMQDCKYQWHDMDLRVREGVELSKMNSNLTDEAV